jgi:hypothetical protein
LSDLLKHCKIKTKEIHARLDEESSAVSRGMIMDLTGLVAVGWVEVQNPTYKNFWDQKFQGAKRFFNQQS